MDGGGQPLWGDSSEGPEVSPGFESDTPQIIGSGTGVIISFRRYPAQTDDAMADIYLQRFDGLGSRLWGAGLPLCRATSRQSRVTATADMVSGVIASWLDERAPGESRIYVGRVNDTGRSFVISGAVEDQSGMPVAGVVLSAEDQGDVVGSRVSGSDGTFSLGAPEFWSGSIAVRPRGYMNHSTPASWNIPPVTQNISGLVATITHEETSWNSGGLVVSVPSPDASRTTAVVGSSGSGCYLAWQDEDQVNSSLVVGQHIDERGDIRWTKGGDAFVGDGYGDHAAAVLNHGNGSALYLWTRSADMFQGIWGQVIDRDMNAQWESTGRLIIAGDQIGQKAVCVDNNGGFFICWSDMAEQRESVKISV